MKFVKALTPLFAICKISEIIAAFMMQSKEPIYIFFWLHMCVTYHLSPLFVTPRYPDIPFLYPILSFIFLFIIISFLFSIKIVFSNNYFRTNYCCGRNAFSIAGLRKTGETSLLQSSWWSAISGFSKCCVF